MKAPRFLLDACLVVAAMAAPAVGQVQVDINRPRTPFDCGLQLGKSWYDTKERCLQELCAGHNTTNEWIFDNDGRRRRRNPCYRIDPFNFDE